MLEIVYQDLNKNKVSKRTINIKSVTTVTFEDYGEGKIIIFDFIDGSIWTFTNHELVDTNIEDIYIRAKVLIKLGFIR